MTDASRAVAYPIGAALTLAELTDDPYPAYARLREAEPVSWVPELGMWLVTRYADVRAVLADPANFTTDAPGSTISDTFGPQMLSLDGPDHDRFKAAFQPSFTPRAVRKTAATGIRLRCERLIEGFPDATVDLREHYASRLPIQTMIALFGLSDAVEPELRDLYDGFEAALANHHGAPAVAVRARAGAEQLRAIFRRHGAGEAHAASLSRAELDHNLSIIFFGGISTVEALLLNTLAAILSDPALAAEIRADARILPAVVEETMRWSGPVQSATRHAVSDMTLGSAEIAAGETVNCMLASANRDAAAFERADAFDHRRPDVRRHLGFAAGTHHCLGSHLARAEVMIGVTALFDHCPALRLAEPAAHRGHEFRQPRSLVCSF